MDNLKIESIISKLLSREYNCCCCIHSNIKDNYINIELIFAESELKLGTSTYITNDDKKDYAGIGNCIDELIRLIDNKLLLIARNEYEFKEKESRGNFKL